MSVTKGQWASGENSNKRDIILWADHRAHKEAAEINASGSMVLKYVGETMSLEMCVSRLRLLRIGLIDRAAGNCPRFSG